MDGSPTVYAKKISEDHLELWFCEVDKKISFTTLCTFVQLRDTLLSSAKKVIRVAERNYWFSENIDKLKDLVVSLEKYPF